MSSTILVVIVLVVMWLVVLVPMFVRRHDDAADEQPAGSGTMRVLPRRAAPTTDGPPVQPDRGAEAPATSGAEPRADRSAGHPPAEILSPARARARARTLARRRRTLVVLLLLTSAGSIGGLLASPLSWLVAAAGAGLLTGYLGWLRQQVRREQLRRARRAVLFGSATAPPLAVAHTVRSRPGHRRSSHPTPAARSAGAALGGDSGSGSHRRRSAAGGAGRSGIAGTWEPVPVPVPTYVTRPSVHGRRAPAVVGLDDDDLTFADLDAAAEAVEHPRAVNS